MSTFVYKNLLIIERNTNNVSSKNFLRLYKQFDFPDRKPFDYKSNKDKIILFSSIPYNSTNCIYKLQNENINPTNNFKGIIKLLCDSHNIKVIYANFTNYDICIEFLNMFREYIIATIKSINTNQKTIYTLYWDDYILNNMNLRAAIMATKLIKDFNTNLQNFNIQGEIDNITLNNTENLF
jgi:hypothetical protein